MKLGKGFLLRLLSILFFIGCNQSNPVETESASETQENTIISSNSNVPTWAKSATLYEVNLRQFTPEGTFAAFSKHLPRLAKMGVDILWFMPIHPISVKNRKGTLGSPYAIGDYQKTNPEFGTLQDFNDLVQKIHDLGMQIIIDWVPNHTGWDNPWITEHPEWYSQDSLGNIIDPINPETGESWGWTDVADLNYDIPEMRLEMINSMKFWIEKFGIDGFRCDVAHNVPVDFWEQATDSLYSIKPLFMLAEAEIPEIRNNGSFVADYSWGFHHLINDIAKGEKKASDIDIHLKEDSEKYKNGYHIYFTSNHDENTWAGTVFERMGDAHLPMAVLTATIDGMPLLYSGQEAGNKKRLAFFEKDSIEWGNYQYEEFYSILNDLKHQNPALWNGKAGGNLIRINTDKDQNIYAFMREKEENRVVVVLNLSKIPQEFKLQGGEYVGEYNNVFVKGTTALTEDMMMNLDAWEYMVLSNL